MLIRCLRLLLASQLAGWPLATTLTIVAIVLTGTVVVEPRLATSLLILSIIQTWHKMPLILLIKVSQIIVSEAGVAGAHFHLLLALGTIDHLLHGEVDILRAQADFCLLFALLRWRAGAS